MVLLLNGVRQTKCPQNTQSLYRSHPGYRESAGQLLAMPNKVIGPAGLLYVLQREFAVTMPHDKNVNIIGSDDATTCIIVVVRHSSSAAMALGHFDGTGKSLGQSRTPTSGIDTEEAACTMIQRVQELSIGYEGKIELQLIGGYADVRQYSEELFFNIMNIFHKHIVEVDLTLACVGQLNSTIRGGVTWPIIYGVGVDIKTGEIFPATFPEKGPLETLRCARHLSGDPQIIDVYDCNLGLLKIGPFNYKPLRGVDLWLEQNDDFILQHLSTSPEVEPPHFVMQIRAALKYIQENPFPAITVFRDNRPLYFRRDEQSGMWVPLGC